MQLRTVCISGISFPVSSSSPVILGMRPGRITGAGFNKQEKQ
jgi:hypothetical protein